MQTGRDIVAIEMRLGPTARPSLARLGRDVAALISPMAPAGLPEPEGASLVHLTTGGLRISLGRIAAGPGQPVRLLVSAAPCGPRGAERALEVTRALARTLGRRYGCADETWHNLDAPLDAATMDRLAAPQELVITAATTPLDDLLAQMERVPTLRLVASAGPAVRLRGAPVNQAEARSVQAMARASGAGLTRMRLGVPANAATIDAAALPGPAAIWMLQVSTAA